jgi:hypothetical protein
LEGTTIYDLPGRLLRDTFGRTLKDQDAFLVFVLFHSHRVVLCEPILTDRPGITEVFPHSQRGVSSALASLWEGTDDPRANYVYWYYKWNGEWRGYDHADHLTDEERERFEFLKQRLEEHPFVTAFEPEN